MTEQLTNIEPTPFHLEQAADWWSVGKIAILLATIDSLTARIALLTEAGHALGYSSSQLRRSAYGSPKMTGHSPGEAKACEVEQAWASLFENELKKYNMTLAEWQSAEVLKANERHARELAAINEAG